jgi:hypothetical protein
MKIQDVIEDLKDSYPDASELRRRVAKHDPSDVVDAAIELAKQRKLSALAKRVHKYGVRVICMMCSEEARHRPGEGRLRNRACHSCGMQRLRPVWWIEKYPTKAAAEVKRVRGTSFLL